MHNKDKVVFDKKLPYEYNITIIILVKLYNKGIIDIFDMAEALIKLRKLYNLPFIDISASVCLHQQLTINNF